MDSNGWYSTPNGMNGYGRDAYLSPDPTSSRTDGMAVDSVADSHQLLSAYPLASLNPTGHVSRQLSNLSLSAQPPSYAQPQYYALSEYTYPSQTPAPYTEYAPELNHLQSQQLPVQDGGYWENTRNDAVQYLSQPSHTSYPQHPSAPNYWPSSVPSQSPYAQYRSNAFAHSVFQHTVPSISYPTPPPPAMKASSSSLAFALGAPPQPSPPRAPLQSSPPKPQPPLPQRQQSIISPQESSVRFNVFVDQTSREIERAQAARYSAVMPPSTPSRRDSRTNLPPSSPDPLAVASVEVVSTPQKRKPIKQLQSPSVKRVQTFDRTSSSSSLSSALSSSPIRSASSSLSKTSYTNLSTSIDPGSLPRTTPKVKPKMQPYVDLPPMKAKLTPSSQKSRPPVPSAWLKGKTKREEDDGGEPDLGGFGSEEEEYQPHKTSLASSSASRSPTKKTGDRDERAPLEKLTALLDDIFEAEDSLPAEPDLESLPSDFFSPISSDPARPQLQPNLVRKLTKHIGLLARPKKRLRPNSNGNTPRSTGPVSLSDVEPQTLSRVLKILERSVKAGEYLEPFPSGGSGNGVAGSKSAPSSPTKKKGGKGGKKGGAQAERRSKSRTPRDEDEDSVVNGVDLDELHQSLDAAKLSRSLELARDSILAADCCIALLGSDRLTKQLYSEELINACLSSVKNQLNKIIYPFIEFSSSSGESSTLRHVAKSLSSEAYEHRRQVADIFQALLSILPRINGLVNADVVAMSDSIIIQAVYIAIGPFFVVEDEGGAKAKKDNLVVATLGQTAMQGLRLDALSLTRSIFANHEEQRSWIIEEILSSLIKLSDTKQKAGQFRLRDGRSIRTVSALLLQLVQTSAHGVRISVKRLGKSRQQAAALKRHDSMTSDLPEQFLEDVDQEEISLYLSGLESATKAAKTIVVFLTQRSGKGKATKNSNEAEYRLIFDNLISDLLVVLFWPEWPAASLLLTIICKFMISSLDDVKSMVQTDNNAVKQIALDHLGVIAARLRTSTLKFKLADSSSNGNTSTPLRPMEEIFASCSSKDLQRLVAAHREVVTHLSRRSTEDQACDSARELSAVTWGQELAIALRRCNASLSNDGDDIDLIKANNPQMLSFGVKVKSALRDVWTDATTDVFSVGSQDEVAQIDKLAEEVGVIQELRHSYQPILNVILLALDAQAVFMRTKALRALGQIVTSDPTILSAPNVRRGIESHLLDNSPAVRDAAVELIGKYMIDSPEVAADYYQKIADRIADTGLGVRKRVIKLLKSFYSVTDDSKRRIDICTKLVLRMFDEDDTVKDLAVKSIEDLWFQTPIVSSLKSRNASSENSAGRSDLLAKVSIIMGVSANFKDRQSPLEDMLHKIMADKEGTDASVLHERYTEICEALIDGLVDATELPGFTIIHCIRTIYLFTTAYPAVLSGSNASTLLPYLKNATSIDEQVTSDYLLKIFRASVPHMPKTAMKFGQELQLALQPMILKPSTAGGTMALQETVACICAVVEHLTHDYGRLVALLKSCNQRLMQAINKPRNTKMSGPDMKTLCILIFIVSLLVEHCDFDRLRRDNTVPEADLNVVSSGSIIEHVYTCLLQLYDKYAEAVLRGRILQALGFLFRAQPTLMTLESSAAIMDAIFASPEEDSRGRLLKIMQEFLISEASKHADKEKKSVKSKSVIADVNMEELVGNTDGFADSGVSSAIVQRYLEPILEAALSQHAQIQASAIDILSFTVKQGLAHPLQSFPIIVSLETNPSTVLSNRANALHALLHSKHATLLNSRYTVSAKASFDYQVKLSPGPVQGYRIQHAAPTALLQRWYSLVREKRNSKIEFLKSLVRVFEMKPDLKCMQEEVHFARYMVENFATFDYKSQEEVLMVVKTLISILSTSGMQLMETLSPSDLLDQLRGRPTPTSQLQGTEKDVEMADTQQQPLNGTVPDQSPALCSAPSLMAWQSLDYLPIMRSSVILAMLMLLKRYLKNLYGVSEEKCSKWVIGKKNTIGDKPATRRHQQPLQWDRLPFATVPIHTTQDMAAQRTTFLEIWDEDGVAPEPEDDMD